MRLVLHLATAVLGKEVLQFLHELLQVFISELRLLLSMLVLRPLVEILLEQRHIRCVVRGGLVV